MHAHRFSVCAAIAVLASCSSLSVDVKRDPAFKATAAMPIRVAVLPFEDKTGSMSPLLYPLLPFVWLADLLTLQLPAGTPDPAKGAETLRELLIARLRGSTLNVVDPATVGTVLHHAGLAEKANKMDPRELGKVLGVDAILYGTLEGWGGDYYLVESRTVVAATVSLRSCVDGRELFRASVTVADAAGVTEGPTGYVSAVASPLAALGTGPYRRLAIDWNEAVGMELTGAWCGTASAAASTPAPYVTNVALSPTPTGGYQPGAVIEVLAIGSQGCRATFDLGTLRVRVPMVEYAHGSRTGVPDPRETASYYRGSYVVTGVDRVRQAPVTVTLESPGGRAVASSPDLLITIGF